MNDKKGRNLFLLNATSANVDPTGKTHIVLYWTPQKNVTGYNLYRSETATIPRRARPINGKRLICPVQTCAELKAIIPPGSKEWNQLVNAFSAFKSRASMKMASDSYRRAYFKDRSVLEGLRGRPFPSRGIEPLLPDALPWEIDPCDVINRGLTAEEKK